MEQDPGGGHPGGYLHRSDGDVSALSARLSVYPVLREQAVPRENKKQPKEEEEGQFQI